MKKRVKARKVKCEFTDVTPPQLTALQVRLTNQETTSNLAKATAETRKDLIKLANSPLPTTKTAQSSAPTQRPASARPSYADNAASPQRPSTVLDTSAYTWPDDTGPSPSAGHLRHHQQHAVPHDSTQVRLSARHMPPKWTAKGNLVIGGPPPYLRGLAGPILSLHAYWSLRRPRSLHTGGVPPSAPLSTENHSYAALTISQKLSWVCDPASYKNPWHHHFFHLLFSTP